jgi:stearoyl-CoA desaturase (delta-9 desaturase)
VGALLAFVPALFTWKALATAFVIHALSTLGVTVGYHRLLTHRSYKTFKPIEYLLSWFGSLSLQGGPIKWTAIHRLHHQHSDEPEDPHSPKHGFFWAHALWLFAFDPQFDPYEKYSRYAADLASDPGHRLIERLAPLSQVLLAVALYVWGGWPCVVWGGFVRLVYVYHMTWFINSASHTWGYRTYKTTDDSRNLWWLALLSFGEGWHNNHHAFPNSARHGLRFWEIDFSWMIIRGMRMLGLVRDVRVPSPTDTPDVAMAPTVESA